MIPVKSGSVVEELYKPEEGKKTIQLSFFLKDIFYKTIIPR